VMMMAMLTKEKKKKTSFQCVHQEQRLLAE
jgi:hypothetical protein